MSPILAASLDDVLELLVVQVWVYQARGGDRAGARARAERAVERLLSRGLPQARAGDGTMLLDPYATCNALKTRAGEHADEAWIDWLETLRRNAVSLPPAPHRYRFHLNREWRLPSPPPGRAIVLRLPLPLRGQLGTPQVRLLEPAGALMERRDEAGRVELRLDPQRVRGSVVVEMAVDLVAGETRELVGPSASDPAAAAEEELWLRPSEGLIGPSPTVAALARDLPGGPGAARELARAAFDRLISLLQFGDVHREHLDREDPLGGLLKSSWADCALFSTLFVAICRARGVPARLVSGFLLYQAEPSPHHWAEVLVEPGRWVPYDFGTWDYSAGDTRDPVWGAFFRERIDGRFTAEVAPRHFTGWGSARPPERWLRLQRLTGDRYEHTLRVLPSGELFQRDLVAVETLGPA
jgi:hypothetical protein